MDTENILDLLDPRGRALEKAKALNSQAMSLPQPPNTGSTFKDFLLNSMSALNLPTLGAKMPTNNITGGTQNAVLNPGSSKELALLGDLTSNLGVKQVSGAGIAENANKYNPRVNEVLNYLSNRELPIDRVSDHAGGTSYITSKNPTDNSSIRIRIPGEDSHLGRRDTSNTFMSRHGNASYFDLGTSQKGLTYGVTPPHARKNQSGEMYGKDTQALFDAIDHATGKNLVSEGRAPNYSKNVETKQLTPEKSLSIDDLIDSTLKDMEQPSQYISKDIKDARNPMPIRNMEQPQLTIGEMSSQSKFASDPAPYNYNKYMKRQGELEAANTGQTPNAADPLETSMLKTDSGKYKLATIKQQLQAKGVDTANMSVLEMYLKLHGYE